MSSASDTTLLFTRIASARLLSDAVFAGGDYRGINRYHADVDQATFFGDKSNAQSQGSTAFGALARALDIGATAIGYAALASGRYSVALGDQAAATKFRAIAIGRQANATGIQSVSIGYKSSSAGQDSLAIGANAVASGLQCVHVGNSGTTSGARGTTVGQGSNNSGDDATLVGQGGAVSGARSTAVGQGNTIAHADCVIVGKGGTTTATGQVLIGTASTVFTDVYMGRGQTHVGAAGALKVRTAAGSGANVAGDDMELRPGPGTGNAAGGTFKIYRAPAGSSGSALNTEIPIVQISSDGRVKFSGKSDGAMPNVNSGLVVIGQEPGANLRSGLVLATTTDGNAHLGTVFIGTDLGYMAISSTRQGTAGHLPLTFWCNTAGLVANSIRAMELGQGLMMNNASGTNPIGGDQGAGTINVIADIYKNGSAYNNPDYVFEKYFTGKMDKTKDRPGAKGYQGLMSLEDIEDAVRTKHRLPLLDSTLADSRAARKQRRLDEIEDLRGKTLLDVHGNPYTIPDQELNQRKTKIQALKAEDLGDGMFDRADAILAQFEEITLHVIDVHKRLKVLEAKNK